MFTQIVSAIRKEILDELEKRVKKGTRYVFYTFNDDGDDVVYAPINVGRPSDEDYFPDVMNVYRNEKGKVIVVVQDEVGKESEYEITDFFLDICDLAAILDAIVNKEAKEGQIEG